MGQDTCFVGSDDGSREQRRLSLSTPADVNIQFTQLFGRWTDHKKWVHSLAWPMTADTDDHSDVITGATWRLTGGVRSEGTFRSNGKTEG